MRRQLVAFGAVVMTIALCACTAGALGLQQSGERAFDRQLSLQRVQTELRAQEGLMWRAINAESDRPSLTDALTASLRRVERALLRGHDLGLSARRTHTATEQAKAYAALVGRELNLLGEGESDAADTLGQQQVDPALRELRDGLDTDIAAARHASDTARRYSSLAVVLLGGSVLLVFAIGSLRMRSLEKRRRRQREALDDLQRDFVAATSHDLRTPLTSILGYGEILADDGELDPARRTAAAAIVRNSQRLRAIADNLLFLSSHDAGRSDRLHTPVDLGAVIGAVRPMIESLTRSRALYVEFLLPDEPVRVNGDAIDLERIVSNLVGNAVKFTPDGGEILCRMLTEGDKAVIEVHDTGMGISREDQQYLFTRFFRARAVRERAIIGTGLGLSIVASVVEDHGGTVSVRSTEGRGSTFTVTLPLVHERVPAVPDAELVVGA